MNNLNKWYRPMGVFLISFSVLTGSLFLVRFTLMKSAGFVIFLDDFLTIGLANIFLLPCGIWLFYTGSRCKKYARVNNYPLVLISVSPTTMLALSFIFLLTDFTGFSFSFSSFGEAQTLAVYFAIVVICAISFISGNILLLYQIIKSKKAIRMAES